MMIALDYVWDKIKSDRTKKKAIMIDEIWQLIGAGSNRMAAEFCLEIFKVIRGFGGAAISATQDLSDFFGLEDGRYGRAIINNSKNKIILNLEPDEAEFVRDTLKLTKTEIRSITRFERGEALICSNNSKVPVIIKASKEEQEILCVPVTPVYAVQQGADGSKLQVVKAEQLEIQLGTSWSGVEFQLKTDAGVYPGTVKVGTDGVLRLEIGGSSQYILTCMNSSTSIPEPEGTADLTDQTQAPATTEQTPESNEKAASGIPTLHIILFAGGMVIAIGTLIVMQIFKKKRENESPDDEEDEE